MALRHNERIVNYQFNCMKKSFGLFVLILLAIFSVSAKKYLGSSVFDWQKFTLKKISSGESRNILKSPTRSLDMFDIKAITIYPGKNALENMVEKGSDELIIIKEGVAEIQVNNINRVLEEGSLIVASSGDKVAIKNAQKTNSVYYSIRFKPYQKDVRMPNVNSNSPVFIDWNKLEYKTTEKGGSRAIMRQQTSELKELEIHVTTLNEGITSHGAHSHTDEEIILVRKGFVEETISGKPYRLGPGSIIFLTNDDPHNIKNAGTGQCEYYAIRWLTGSPVQK
jgi:uncharacterized cupin superfamily protein